jgi:UDP-glucose 4-epimerase
MKKNTKILVSGERGFIGSHLVTHLIKRGVDVIGKEYGDYNSRSFLDVTDLSRLLSYEDYVDTIIHLAAKTSVYNSFRSPHDTYYTNLLGTLNLLEFARQKKVPKFIYISTYVYGKPQYLPVDENHPIDPHSPYNKSKLLAEQLCKFYSNDYGIDVVTLRPFHIYGSRPRTNSLIYCILEQITKRDGKVTLSGKSTKRDFLFIDDFLILIEEILKKFPSGYNVFNVGYGKSYTLIEISQILAKLLNKKISIEYCGKKLEVLDIPDIVADLSKISKEFNWKPAVSLEQGLQSTVVNYAPSDR